MSKKSKYILIGIFSVIFLLIFGPKNTNAAWVCQGATGCSYWQSSCTLCPNCLKPACWENKCTGFSSKNCTASCGPANCGVGSCGTPTNSCGWNCVPDCGSQQCGTDSCGQSCGTCTGGRICNASYQCVLPPSCSATAPTNVSVTRLSPTSATLSWTPGANGNEQRVYVGANKSEVETNCGGTYSPACVVSVTGLPTSQSSYSTGNVLTTGTVYYYRVVNWLNGSCAGTSPTNTTVSSCRITTSPLTIEPGANTTMSTETLSSTDISSVNFSSGNAAIATVNPATDNAYLYQTTVTGVAAGSTTANADVIIGGSTNCTATAPVNVTSPDPWWQITDADVATNSDLNSKVPTGKFFDTIGGGGYPGIPAYGGVTNLAAGKISTNGWVAASGIGSTKTFNYNFFSQAIPSDTVFNVITTPNIDGSFLATGGAKSGGYYWYKFDGAAGATSGLDLTITNPASIGNRKIVLLVGSANLNLKGNINLTKGQGFFMAIAGKDVLGNKGKITVDPTVGGGGTNLEGIYFADGAISTGTTGAKNDSQLKFRGAVSGNGGISLQRDLGGPANTTTPAEVFEYAPDQIMLFPKVLGVRKINWKEVAP